MLKTIFSKLFAVFMIILVFSFSVTGVLLYFFMTDLVSNEKEQLLVKGANDIDHYLMSNLDYIKSNPISIMNFEYFLQVYSQNTNSLIWIVDQDGRVLFSQPKLDQFRYSKSQLGILKKFKQESGYFLLPDEKQYKSVFENGGLRKEIGGDFYGLFEETRGSWLTVQRLFQKEDIQVVIHLSTPLYEMDQARMEVFKLFMFSVSITILIAAVLAYLFSFRITRPLKQINNAAKIIASGEFQKQLDIRTNDEIQELANSFNQMVYALKNLEEMRRGFIANVSHELRTPMTSIRGFIEGILDGTIPPERQDQYLTIVRDEIVRLNRLVNDLLDLARMEAGEIKLTLKPFNINELIRRCVIKLENMILEKEIQLEVHFEEEEMQVWADSDAIERVVTNLMHNAAKFTPRGGMIVISASEQRERIVVSIEDNGMGIDKDEVDQIWERFYKSDKSRSKDKTGTGLGLSIVKNIIHEHGQEIWVESEVGKGTKFSFSLKKANKTKE